MDDADIRPVLKLGVLISGSGTNLQAIIDAVEQRRLNAELKIVVSNRQNAHGIERARRHGIRTDVIDHRRFASREEFDRELASLLRWHDVELVACAGFMRLLSPVMLRAFPNRIMNIHPALLPAFPGLHVHKAVLEYGARFSGCTVFFVREGLDDGPIIVQATVPVYPNDDEDRLAERVLAQEHRIYPFAISLYQQGRLEIRGRQVYVKGYVEMPGANVLVNPVIV